MTSSSTHTHTRSHQLQHCQETVFFFPELSKESSVPVFSEWRCSWTFGLSLLWMSVCLCRTSDWAKATWQIWQRCGFSYMCRSRCPRRPRMDKKDFPQMLQLCVFWWPWRWRPSSSEDSECSPQTPHSLAGWSMWVQLCLINMLRELRGILQTTQDRGPGLSLLLGWIFFFFFTVPSEWTLRFPLDVFSSVFTFLSGVHSSTSSLSTSSVSLQYLSLCCTDQCDSGPLPSGSSSLKLLPPWSTWLLKTRNQQGIGYTVIHE